MPMDDDIASTPERASQERSEPRPAPQPDTGAMPDVAATAGAGPQADVAPETTTATGTATVRDARSDDSRIRYYDDVRLVEDEGIYRLDFIRTAQSPPPTPSIRNLQLQIEDVERLVNVLFQGDGTRKRRFFGDLHLTAFSGFVSDNCSVEVGLDNLQTVKNNIADAYPLIREPIWWANFWFLVGTGTVCALAAILYHSSTGQWLPTPDKGRFWTGVGMAFFLIPFGCAAGLFAEFLFRVNDDIPYERLRAINPGRWRPGYRAVNTTVVAFIFAALLSDDIIQVGVSGTLLNSFKDGRQELSLAIGFVTGFAFPYVRDLLQQVRPERRGPTL